MSHKIAKQLRHQAVASISITLTADNKLEVNGIPNDYNLAQEMMSQGQRVMNSYFVKQALKGNMDERGIVKPPLIQLPNRETPGLILPKTTEETTNGKEGAGTEDNGASEGKEDAVLVQGSGSDAQASGEEVTH